LRLSLHIGGLKIGRVSVIAAAKTSALKSSKTNDKTAVYLRINSMKRPLQTQVLRKVPS